MVEVTEADKKLLQDLAINLKNGGSRHDREKLVATHRIEAAKAERDRLLAEIADYLEGFAGGHYVVQSCASVVRNWQAAALESQP